MTRDYAWLKPLNLTPYQTRTIKRETEALAKLRQDYAVQMTTAMILNIISDKFAGGHAMIPTIMAHLRKMCEEAADGSINLNDILDTMRQEYDIDLR